MKAAAPQAQGPAQPSQGQNQCVCGPDDRTKRVLMVRRLHPAVTMQMLLQTFGVFGSVTGCKVFTHKSGRSAGCASLEFSNHQAACAALKGLQGIVLHGKHVMLQWFDQTMSAVASPVGRGPGQRNELTGGSSILSEGGSCLGSGRALSSTAGGVGSVVRNNTASCPGLSPFGMFAAAAAGAPGTHPFCNSTAAMAAAAAAAAAVAAQQQGLQHPNDAAAATAAAALLSSQHNLPPLVVQQLQRQVSAPLGAFGQLSPTGAHIPPSPLTPASHGGGWEALISPVGPHPSSGQQPFAPGHQRQQQQQRESATSSRGGVEQQQQHQGPACWGVPSHSPAALAAAAAAAKLSSAMGTGSIGGASQENINMAASLQHLANMQQQALAYAAWQNHHQQAAAAMLQQQMSGQLPGAHHHLLGSHAAQMHLLGARSMPNELGHSLSTEMLLQQATANLHHHHHHLQQQQGYGGGSTGEDLDRGQQHQQARSSAGAAGSLSRQHSTPVMHGSYDPAAAAAASGGSNSSAGGADSIPGGGAAGGGHGQMDQGVSGPLRVRSPAGGRRRSTGALSSVCEGLSNSSSANGAQKACGGPEASSKKHLQWEDQRQHAGDQRGDSGGLGGAGAGGSCKGGTGGCNSSGAEGGRSSGRSSSHQLLNLRGYSGSDDTANVSPDVNALASALAANRQQQQEHAAAAAAAAAHAAAAASVSSCYLSSPTWLGAQRHGLGASQLELMASLQSSSSGGGSSSSQQGLQRSPSAASALQQQQQQSFILAAAAASGGGGSPSHGGGFGQKQQQQQGRGSNPAAPGYGSAADGSRFAPQSSQAMLYTSPSLPGPSAVAAALDAMSVAAATAAAQGWQQRQQQECRDATEAASPAASEAFKHKHKMQLQLPMDGSGGAPAHSSSLTGAPSDPGFDLITTEVLPESPTAVKRQSQQQQQPANQQQQHLYASHSPFGAYTEGGGSAAAAGAAGPAVPGGSDGGSAWANWSASMAALLSPAHVSSLASRRFEDLITLQHGLGQEELGVGAAQAAAAGARGPGGMGGDGWQQQQQRQGQGGASSRPGSLLMTGAGSDMFGPPAAEGDGDDRAGGGVGSVPLGKTRHNSLCLDSRPGLLTLSHMFQVQAQDVSARPSPRGPSSRSSSPQQQQQQPAPAAKQGEAGGGAAAGGGGGGSGGNAGFGSFTFQPPVLRSFQQGASNLGSGMSSGFSSGFSSSSSNPNAMICQPFQLPDFFSRESSRLNCTSPRGSVSTPGGGGAGGGGGSVAAAGSAAAACSGGRANNNTAARQQQQRSTGSTLQPSGMQHQLSENLNGLRIPEGFATGLDAADRTPGSPIAGGGARNLQHSFSMPARFSAPGGAGDALAAAAAAAVAANERSQQQRPAADNAGGAAKDLQQRRQQQQGASNAAAAAAAGQAAYGEMFKSIWGPNAASGGR